MTTSTERRALYLDPHDVLRVRTEGPSLVVDDPERRYRRYPLRLLSRIVCRGKVHWRGDALQDTVRAGVTVAFLDPEGDVRAICAGGADDRLGLGEHIELAMLAPEWPERYQAWQRAQENRVARHALTALRLAPELATRPSLAWPRVMERVVQRHGTEGEAAFELLCAPLRAHVCAALGAAGVGPKLVQGWSGGAALGSDCTRILRWPLASRFATSPMPGPRTFREAAALYETWLLPRLQRSINRLVYYLWRLG